MTKILTLLMPTRNRAEYLSAGVDYFLKSTRNDIELIVSDASDSHEHCKKALAPWRADPRLVLIDNSVGTTGKLSSMTENWSCALDRARGRWLIIVGDDDVCDPAVVEFIEQVEALAIGIEVVTWHTAHFDIGIDKPREAKIPLGNRIFLAAGRDSVIRQAQWPDPKKPPTSLCSPYHGAVSIDLLRRLKVERGGVWFRFRIPDYDLGWSLAWLVERFAVCERPFSITGVCPKSNSYSVRSESRRVAYLENWIQESRALDGWGVTNDTFLFTLPMTVLGFRDAFCAAHGINVAVDPDNLIGTLKNSLHNQEDEYSFEQHRVMLSKFLVEKFGHDFGVGILENRVRSLEPIAGLVGNKLVVPNALFGGDMTRFAEMAFGVVRPVKHLFSQAS